MIPFDPKLSSLLDEATYKAERGSRMWAAVKALIERVIFRDDKRD